MKNVWLLFRDDLRRLHGNVVTIIAVIGLIALPSIFSWYNIIACWNVFDNTGNLTVAVANSDEGYESDVVSMRITIGDQIVSKLRENDQLDWTFTDEKDAIEGVRSGRYYAAVVIPHDYSRTMLSFYSDDVAHAHITYYSNQKKSAIAPKVTDQGADRVAAQVNKVFAETVSEVALGVSTTVLDYLDNVGADDRLGDLADHMKRLSSQLDSAASALSSYSTVLMSAQSLITESNQLMAQSQEAADQLSGTVEEARTAAGEVSQSLEGASSSLNATVAQLDTETVQIPGSVQSAFSNAEQAASEAEALLRDEAALLSDVGKQDAAQQVLVAADSLRASNAAAQASKADVDTLVSEANASLDAAKQSYNSDLKPALDNLVALMAKLKQSITDGAQAIQLSTGDLSVTTNELMGKLDTARQKLDGAIAELGESSRKLSDMSQAISGALSSGDKATLRKIIGSDPATLASAVAAPVQLDRHAVYPVENFGSAMAPLYTTLALWIGALLIMVTLKVVPSERSREQLDNPTPRQLFMGRFLVVAFLSFLQSTVLSLGNLLFLGVQAEHPLLYVLCFWVSGFVFAFIIYTMVALFANLGKALGVVLLIVQVGGGGGSFPLQLLPQFFQDMSPFLPIAHAVKAMRAAMFGIYANDFWIQMGDLLLFVVPFAILGLVLQKPLSMVVPKFVEKVESSKLM